jgi:hypothetical protein
MNSPGRHNPDALIGPELEPANQPYETRKDRISSFDVQAEEAFACLVVDAICLSVHSFLDHGDGQATGHFSLQIPFKTCISAIFSERG